MKNAIKVKSGLLISFCNTLPYLKLEKRGYSSLGMLDRKEETIYWIRLPALKGDSGITGLSQSKKYIFALYQAEGSRVVVFDKEGLGIKYWSKLPQAKDGHSILFTKGFLYVVSTGTDRVLKYRIEGGEIDLVSAEMVWKPDGSIGKTDTHHINSICRHKNSILVSAFGLKKGERWSSARNGYIVDLESGKEKVKSIYHPHSVFSDGEKIVFCESSAGFLRKGSQVLVRFNNGYTRGLTKMGDFWVVGLSSGRRVSKSTGFINSVVDSGELVVNCRAVFLKALSFGEKAFSFDFGNVHQEIYDILAIRGDFLIKESNIVGKTRVKKRSEVTGRTKAV